NERESEYAQQYEAWRAKNPEKAAQSALHLHPDSEGSWNELMNTFDNSTLRNSRKVKQLVQAGMPPRMRARIYYKLSGAAALEKTGEYTRLVALEKIPIYDVIERDVSRCYPDHSMFVDADGQGQRQLRRILRAYSQYNAEVGYCQGMGRLVGLFLIIGLSEERAFWVLAATIKEYVPNYYLSDLGGLRLHTVVFDSLLRERNPKLHAHLSEQGCDALMYVTPWFMTIFTLSLPWETALRVWDWFIYRGTKVLFRVALAITDLASNYLLAACPTIAEQLGFFLHIPPSLVAPDVLIGAAVRVKLTERHIERLTRAA
ncbi:rab-GTPase-TBC domain-containing protein, partial [Kickxella alabastrina]|uniref:rab-GTPase-TBC domain-containing protein n=1 Tax=Kickxella alabastrina TaxID=61397 RepID=UPI0022211FE4